MNDYYYDYGWQWEDNHGAYNKNKNYRVFKNYKDGRVEAMTDPMPRGEAIDKLHQIHLLDPVGQVDWVEELREERREMRAAMNSYLREKGRL